MTKSQVMTALRAARDDVGTRVPLPNGWTVRAERVRHRFGYKVLYRLEGAPKQAGGWDRMEWAADIILKIAGEDIATLHQWLCHGDGSACDGGVDCRPDTERLRAYEGEA